MQRDAWGRHQTGELGDSDAGKAGGRECTPPQKTGSPGAISLAEAVG